VGWERRGFPGEGAGEEQPIGRAFGEDPRVGKSTLLPDSMGLASDCLLIIVYNYFIRNKHSLGLKV
jgi:hypothetical protein